MSDNNNIPGNGPYRAERAEHKLVSQEQTDIERLKTEVEGLKLQLESLRRKEKWEYATANVEERYSSNLTFKANKFGKCGWELVSTEATHGLILMVFKRPL
jgi:hypothetical protein